MKNLCNMVLWKLHLTKIKKCGKNIKINNKNKITVLEQLYVYSNSFLSADKGKISIKSGKICEFTKLLACDGNIKIGRNVQVGDFCFFSGQGDITIGDNVLFASFVSLIANEHIYTDIYKPIMEQGSHSEAIIIGNGCWIGIKSTILSGSVIGNNCVIGANSVVKGIFPDNCVVVGSPAKIIKIYNPKTKVWDNVQ